MSNVTVYALVLKEEIEHRDDNTRMIGMTTISPPGEVIVDFVRGHQYDTITYNVLTPKGAIAAKTAHPANGHAWVVKDMGYAFDHLYGYNRATIIFHSIPKYAVDETKNEIDELKSKLEESEKNRKELFNRAQRYDRKLAEARKVLKSLSEALQ